MATWFVSGLPPGLSLFAYYLRESAGTIQIRNTTTAAWVNLSTNPIGTDVDTAVTEIGTNTGTYSWADPAGVDGETERVHVVIADKSVTTSLNPEVSTVYAEGPLIALANVAAISDDKTAADNLETMLDGTGGQTLSLGKLAVNNSAGPAVELTGGTNIGYGVIITGGSANSGGADAVRLVGGTCNLTGFSGYGLRSTGGAATASGITAGDGIAAVAGTASDGGTAAVPIRGDITGSLSGSVGSVTAAVTLTAGERNSVADALLDRADAVETGITPRLYMRRTGAVIAGKLSGAGTGTEVFKGIDVETIRVTVTVEDSGNRTTVTFA